MLQMHKKFQVNRPKIKGGCQSEKEAAQQHSYIDLTLTYTIELGLQPRDLLAFFQLLLAQYYQWPG